MRIIAGVDGGGTKTKLICKSLDGNDEHVFGYGPFNINAIGESAFRSLLSRMVEDIVRTGECEAICLGAAGVSNSNMRDIVSDVVGSSPIARWSLVGDDVIAMEGALDGGPGIIVISGTGSIVLGRDVAGNRIRLGGWGHLIGDEGSGYGIARDAFKALSMAIDGVGEETSLMKDFGIETRTDLISKLYSGDKGVVASYAMIVEKAAEAGDRVALGILEDKASMLAKTVFEVYSRLHLGKTNVAFIGGQINHDTLFRRLLSSRIAALSDEMICIEPIHDAAVGAVMIARGMI